MDLTVEAIARHDAEAMAKICVQATIAAGSASLLLATAVQVAPVVRNRSCSDASSDLSSILSSLEDSDSSEDDAPAVKRRRKNQSTPPTDIDEPQRKRAPGKRGGRSVQREEDVADRKVYLTQGLYSGVAGNNGIVREQRKQVVAKAHKPKPLTWRDKERISNELRLELPLHHGLALLAEKRDFRLPWDILQDFDLSRLPDTVEGLTFRSDALDRIGLDKTPTWYRSIAQNKYTERLRGDEAPLVAICDCKSGGCDDNCLNRMMQYFCSPKLCRFGSKCTNLPFNSRQVRHDLEVFWTGNRGFGLRTNTPIVAGEFIMEYRGEVISINESYRRVADEYKNRHDYYFLDYYGAEVVDAGMLGNEARFINHSCDPNIQVVRWKMADFDEFQIGMFALRDIDPKEELCYDYGWQAFSSIEGKQVEDKVADVETKPQRCLCAAATCTGFLEKQEPQKQVQTTKGRKKKA